MIIINSSSEAILKKNPFASGQLKDVRGLAIKLHLASVNQSFIFY